MQTARWVLQTLRSECSWGTARWVLQTLRSECSWGAARWVLQTLRSECSWGTARWVLQTLRSECSWGAARWVLHVRELRDYLFAEAESCGAWMRASEYSVATVKRYKQTWRHFAEWVGEKSELVVLSDLSLNILQSYLIELSLTRSQTDSARLLSSSHRSGHISALKWLFRYLHQHGKLLTNPALELKRPREVKALPRAVMTVSEILKLLSHIGTEKATEVRNRAALELMYSTGIRRGEMESLDLDSVRLEERLLFVKGKGKKERLVPIGEEALRCLKFYLKEARPKLLSSESGSEALFVSTHGTRFKMKNLLSALKRYAKEAGIAKPVTLHALRHTCATHMLAGKADIRYIQELLGHASLNTTQLYTRVETSDLKAMLDRCHPRDKF